MQPLLRVFSQAPPFEISPDGQYLVVTADSKGMAMLWVSPILTPAWRQLEGTEGAGGFFWSPDSRHIGFFAARQLKRVALSGGAPETICPAAVGQVPSGAWSGGEVIVFGGSDRLWKVASSGGTPTPVTSLGSGETGHRWPSFLPDYDHFLYMAQTDRANQLRIGSLTAATDTVTLGAFDSNARYVSGRLIFVRGERLVSQTFDLSAALLKDEPLVVADEVAVVVPWGRGQFSISGTGVLGYSGIGRPFSQLTWKNRAGQSLSTVGEPGYYLNLDLNADDTRVAVSRYTQPTGLPWNGDIWTIDLARNAPRRLTTHPARDFDPAWSHDDTDIAFYSSRADGLGLFRRSANGSGEDERLTSGSAVSPDWSPERVLVYTADGQGTGSDLWTLPVSGDRKARPFLNTPFNEAAGEFSPDGRWVAYQSDESGLYEVYVRPFPDGDNESHPISRGGGRYARWRGDGRELFFVRFDGMLMAAGIDSTKGFAAAIPTELFQTSLVPGAYHPYAVSRDGQRFLVPVILNHPGATPITVVLNWMARLRE